MTPTKTAEIRLCDPLGVFTGDVIHDWELFGRWGILIGHSRCKRCGTLYAETKRPCVS
jgi:hypothetical protein